MKNQNQKIILAVLALLCFGSHQLWAQYTVGGQLVDALSAEPLAYVNIGIEGTSTGTVSGPDGSFTLVLAQAPDAAGVRVRCSHIGYEDASFQITASSPANLSIPMTARITELGTVQVKAAKLYPEVLGHDKTDARMSVSFAIGKQPNQNLGAAIAKKMELKKGETALLDSVGFYIRANNFDTVRFRVNVHQLDADKLPGAVLHTQEIIAELTAAQKGWVTVDITPLGLTLTEDFAVSVEWIYHSTKGKYLQMPIAMPVIGSTHYYRYGSQNTWEDYKNMSASIQVYTRKELKAKRKRKADRQIESDSLSIRN